MADYVPTSGGWQTDPVLRHLHEAYVTAAQRDRAAGHMRGAGAREAQAYSRYVEQHRRRLGIPDNYFPDPRTNLQTLYDPNQNQLRDALIIGGSMAAGGYGLGAALGGGSAAAAGGAAGVLPSSNFTALTPLSGVGIIPPAATTLGATGVSGAIGAASGGGGSLLTDLTRRLVSPRGVAGAASLLPLLMQLARGGGGGTSGGSTPLPTGNPFADLKIPEAPVYDPSLADDAKAAYAVQQRRLAQGQPAFDALVAQAYGTTPTRYRGAAPDGYPAAAQAPVAGPYTYNGPTFGRNS